MRYRNIIEQVTLELMDVFLGNKTLIRQGENENSYIPILMILYTIGDIILLL